MSDIFLLCWTMPLLVVILKVFTLLLYESVSTVLGRESFLSKYYPTDARLPGMVLLSLSITGLITGVLGISTTILQIALYLFLYIPKFMLGGSVL